MEEKIVRCPKCQSTNIKESGPFAKRKEEGKKFSEEPCPAKYHCWDCGYDWVERDKSDNS